MEYTLKILDKIPGGQVSQPVTLHLVSEKVTVRELIEKRVRMEVSDHNKSKSLQYRGLVQPTDTEEVLNGYKLKKQRVVDSERQCEVALTAFNNNGFLMLVNDKQVETLEEEIILKPETQVTFIKLVPLVGG